jgi:hypothetical protein
VTLVHQPHPYEGALAGTRLPFEKNQLLLLAKVRKLQNLLFPAFEIASLLRPDHEPIRLQKAGLGGKPGVQKKPQAGQENYSKQSPCETPGPRWEFCKLGQNSQHAGE